MLSLILKVMGKLGGDLLEDVLGRPTPPPSLPSSGAAAQGRVPQTLAERAAKRAVETARRGAQFGEPCCGLAILGKNLVRLRLELSRQAGRKTAILGQPGAGKSSLLRYMTDGQVVPLPAIGVHTDATNWADDPRIELLSFFGGQIFVDAPGYDTRTHPVATFIESFPFDMFDACILVTNGKVHGADVGMARVLTRKRKRRLVLVARSFSEGMSPHDRETAEGDLRKHLKVRASIPVAFFSNRTKEGIDSIAKVILPTQRP